MKSWKKSCKFHNRNEGTKEVKSQTNNNKMHNVFVTIHNFKPFHPQNCYLKENWEEGEYRLDKTTSEKIP